MREQTPLDQLIGNYRLLAPIASGAFATVYQAQHQILQERIVAIKILHMHLNSQQQQQQFLREAHVLEQLRHPQILPLLDVGVTDHFPYLVTVYAKLGSLRMLLQQRPGQLWAWETALSILAQIAAALSYAHGQQVIHRDLKPENILFLSSQEAVLADFGIATVLSTSSMASTTITGTPSYMAPEQFRGQVCPESDQYALGCLAYELVTGHPPFSAPDAIALGFKHTTEPPLPPRHLNQQIAPYVEQAILKALAKERHERHSNVTAFITALYPPTVYQVTAGITLADTILSTSHAPGAQADQQAALQWREKGETLLNQHRYEEALAAYEQALCLNPHDALAYRKKGIALDNLKRYQEALVAYDQALRLNPGDDIAYNNKGYALQDMGRYEEALAAYDQAIRLNPDAAGTYYNKGTVLDDLKRYQEALVAYNQAIRLDPNLTLAYRRKGHTLNSLKRYEEALVAYDQAIRLDPNALTCFNKGVALHNLNRYEKAIAAYDQAIHLDPNFAPAYCNKGTALKELGRYQEGLAAYEEALRLDPKNADASKGKQSVLLVLQTLAMNQQTALPPIVPAFHQLQTHKGTIDKARAQQWADQGWNLANQQHYEEGLQAFEHALQCDPREVNALVGKATCLFYLHRYQEALIEHERALPLAPTRTIAGTISSMKGNTLSMLGRHEEALEVYEQILRLDPGNRLAIEGKQKVLSQYPSASDPATTQEQQKTAKQWREEAEHFLSQSRYEEALAAYEQVLSLDPSDLAAYKGKASLLLSWFRRLEEAVMTFEQVLRLDPKDHLAYFDKAVALHWLRRYEEALAVLEQAQHVNPTFPGAYLRKGDILLSLSRYQEALEAYEQLLHLDPSNQLALEGKQRVLSQQRSSPTRTQVQQKPAKQWREEATPFMVQKRSEHERAEQTSQQTQIEQAEHLLLSGQERAAGSLAGVALEMHLRKRCERYALAYPPKATLQTLIQLLQDVDAITAAEAKYLTGLASIRNKCAHASPVSKDEVSFLVKEVKKCIGFVNHQ